MLAFTSLYYSLYFAKGKVPNLTGVYLKRCRQACKNSAEAPADSPEQKDGVWCFTLCESVQI